MGRLSHYACSLGLVLLVCGCAQRAPERATRQLLDELDGCLQAREMYTARKKDQMAALTTLAENIQDLDRRFDMELHIADEFFAFSFDSTQFHLRKARQVAEQLRDPERVSLATIRLGHLYAKAGHYMEAYSLLVEQTDTLVLPPAQKEEYLLDLYEFNIDLAGNGASGERSEIYGTDVLRNRLLQQLPRDGEQWRILCRDRFMAEGRLAQADSVGRLLLSAVQPEEHKYAIHAFWLSEIANQRGRQQERLAWLVKSAESDILCAVKDYASLTMVGQLILSTDVDRSFRYLRISQEDAIFYNAKLRPWQISRSLMDVETAYALRQARTQRKLYFALGLLGVLVVVLSAGAILLVKRSRKLGKMQLELENANIQLASANLTLNNLNRQISKADQVKQQYILSFLEQLSGQIARFRSEDNRYRNLLKQGKSDQLLRELSIAGRSEKARDEFYESFDRTFLAMYPDFVEQFNALLREDAALSPPAGRLNTELRIFALILLGVDDSKAIASMLDYSVSTIYNYKVAVKNACLGKRDSFEERVKQLGK